MHAKISRRVAGEKIERSFAQRDGERGLLGQSSAYVVKLDLWRIMRMANRNAALLRCRSSRRRRVASSAARIERTRASRSANERAGHRVMESVTCFITQHLKLKVNETKSAVARPQHRKFLGFSVTAGREVKRTIAPKALGRFKARVREITRRAKGVSILRRRLKNWLRICGAGATISASDETPDALVYLTRWVRLRLERRCGASGKHRVVAGPLSSN